jgi:hypothetical protein
MKKFSQIFHHCLIIGVWLLVITLRPPVAFATSGLSIDPPVTEILLAPTHPMSTRLTLSNPGDTPAAFTVALHEVEPSDSQGHVKVRPEPISPGALPLTYSLSPRGENGQYTLAPGASLPLTLSLEAATGTEPTDLYLALVATTIAPSAPRTTTETTTTAGLAGLIFISVTDGSVVPLSLEVKDFPTPALHDPWLPLAFAPTLVNESPTMIHIAGELQITNARGQVVSTTSLYPDLILSGATRTLAGGRGTPLAHLPLSWQPAPLSFGPHTIHLKITTQGGTTILESEKIVWLFPIRVMILIALILLSGTTTLLLIHRHQG